MYATDFEYDERCLSDFGFIICDFNYSNGTTVAEVGSKISFEKVSLNNGKRYSLTSAKYDDCIQTTFDICKNPEIFNQDEMEITDEEYRQLIRWLNRKEFLPFRMFDDKKESCFYNASFNVSKIKIREILYGIELTMETDKPFGYGQTQHLFLDCTDITKSHLLIDVSDEIGYTYPYVRIICEADGDLSIYNKSIESTTLIKNCKKGEEIILEGDTQIITSTYSSHDICNDFNYEFFKISNSFNNRNNLVSVSIPCKLEIKYNPIIKDAP